MSKNLAHTILEPIITEKSTALSQQNKYTFRVGNDSNKTTIKKAFEEIFPGRKVLEVQTSKIYGHSKRTKSGMKLSTDQKKAIITIDGPKIEYFPEVS